MSIQLMYITNRPELAAIAQGAGVERIFVDLETLGKYERQKNVDSVKSQHTVLDVAKVRKVLDAAQLLVRVNPIHAHSAIEINRVVSAGADIIMLPYFRSLTEVTQFVEFVGGRAGLSLLLETPEAAENLVQILQIKGVDEIHIGLHDLSLGYRRRFMFQLIADGTVERLCRLMPRSVAYGFGGIGRVGRGPIPAELLIAEHHRLGSTRAILSRSFLDSSRATLSEAEGVFSKELARIRHFDVRYRNLSGTEYRELHRELCERVDRATPP